MKKCGYAFLILALSTLAFASSKVLPQNRDLSKQIANDDQVAQDIGNMMGNGTEIDPKTLKGDAKAAYNKWVKKNSDFSCAEIITIESLDNMQLIHVCESSEGNGCEAIFNMNGEYLNRTCGTESGEWNWIEQ
jgi:hypothetical protein